MNETKTISPLIKAAVILGASLALGLLFDYLFYGRIPGLSFPVFITVTLGVFIALCAYFQKTPSRQSLWLFLPVLFFGTMAAIRASGPLTLLNFVACLLLLLLIARTALHSRLTALRIGDYVRLPLLPLRFVRPGSRTLASLIATRDIHKNNPLTRQIIRGIALTLPVLIIFLLLFASADLIFQKYVSNLFSFHIDHETARHSALILIVSLGFLGALSYVFARNAESEPAPEATPKSVIGHVESSILLGSVNALFLVFIAIQLAYLFGGQANISAQGFTYAEYARKGFFELLAVGLVAFALLWGSERYAARQGSKHTGLFKALSAVLIVQVIVVMASAFKRLYLYEQAYGFTTLRLYSHAFTVMLAVIFILLAVKIIRSSSDHSFALPTLLVFIAFLGALNLLNPDAFITRQNIARYHTTGKLDAFYLSHLSDDAVPELLGSYTSLDDPNRRSVGLDLLSRYRRTVAETEHPWQSWNWSRSQAEAQLKPHAEELQKLQPAADTSPGA